MTQEMSKFLSVIPDTLKVLHDEVSEVGKTVLMAQLKKQNLITRDELKAQQTILCDIANKLNKVEHLLSEKS